MAPRCEGITVLSDGAYINIGLLVPHRQHPGRPPSKVEKEDNAQQRKVRARVGKTFSRIRTTRSSVTASNPLHHAV
ncbi:hypothetical protein L6J92_09830 [Streptomyces sp. CB09030]|nr:hypothetical protein [Streptomyces sp. CB09030]UOG84347.1 hypothetical protein L6J92_09830 [Streptomyces sp. CB09030]